MRKEAYSSMSVFLIPASTLCVVKLSDVIGFLGILGDYLAVINFTCVPALLF